MPPNKLMDDDGPPRDADLAARVRDLEAALAASRAALPVNLIPEHGAGPGMTINPTWSQAEQAAQHKPPGSAVP